MFGQAADLARAAGDGDALARAALGPLRARRRDPRRRPAAGGAARGGARGDARTRRCGRALLARLAIETYYDGDPARRTALADEAVAIARRLGDPAALAAALNAQRVARWDLDHLAQRRAISEELVAVAVAAGDGLAELQGRNWLVVDLIDAGERAAGRGRDRALRSARASGSGSRRTCGTRWRGARRSPTLDGDARTADALRAELVAYRDRGVDPNIDLVLRAQAGVRWMVRERRGASTRRSSRSCARRPSSRTSRGSGAAAWR